jgi:predicted nuclease with TOPRIM domain
MIEEMESDAVEDIRQRVRQIEAAVSLLQTQAAVNKSEIANINKRLDNVETEHARFPQTAISIFSLIVSIIATAGSLFAAGVLGP